MMTNEKPENDTGDFPAGDGAAEAAAEAAGADRLAELEAENAELKDRALRLMAEMENLRRRTAKEVKDAGQYGITGFARDMLAVSDNLRRALDAVPEDAADDAEPTLKALLEGVEMTEREMLNALEKHGIRKIEPDGEKFDPNFHQAMFEVANPQVPNSTVVQVVQAGYVIGERVLRPAMVGVAKGGPKAAKPEAGEAETAAEAAPEDPEGEQAAGARVDRTA